MKWASVFVVTLLCIVSVVHARSGYRIRGSSIRAVKEEEGAAEKKKPVDAYSVFTLIAEVPQSSGKVEKNIFTKGKFCPNDPSTKPTSSCLQPDVHVDRTLFFYHYAAGHNDSNIMKPKIAVQNTTLKVMNPEVTAFEDHATEGSGRFVVQYKCKIGGSGTITMRMQVTKKKYMVIKWKKICGSGVNQLVSLAPTDLVNVGPNEGSTVIELKTTYPQTYIDFKAPYLTMGDKRAGAKLRGQLQAGSVRSGAKKFTVLYSCLQKIESDIALTVAIPPWNNVTLRWNKNCGGSPPYGLLITQGENTVFNRTRVGAQFKVDENTNVRMAAKRHIFELDPEESRLDFSIRNNGRENLQLGGVVSTVSSPDILAVRPQASDSFFGEDHLSDSGIYSLAAESGAKLSLKCICLAKGKAVVLMSLPIQGYESVEFGFYKECKRPHVFHHSGFMRTAGSLMFFFALLAIGGGWAAYRWYRNRDTSTMTTAKYTRVRVSG